MRRVLGVDPPLLDPRLDAGLLEQARKSLAQLGVAGAIVELEQFYLHEPDRCRAKRRENLDQSVAAGAAGACSPSANAIASSAGACFGCETETLRRCRPGSQSSS